MHEGLGNLDYGEWEGFENLSWISDMWPFGWTDFSKNELVMENYFYT